jgi:streptogramin lyase
MQITTIGLDIAKNVFQVHGKASAGCRASIPRLCRSTCGRSLPIAGHTPISTPAAFDGKGRIWFTGQNGIYGRLNPTAGDIRVWDTSKGRGPYGKTQARPRATSFVSLAGSYLANVDLETGAATGGGQDQTEKNLRKAITYAALSQRARIAFSYASFNAFVRSSAS